MAEARSWPPEEADHDGVSTLAAETTSWARRMGEEMGQWKSPPVRNETWTVA
jgi:hypothetical protein